jgi:hypothetical protein
MRNIVLFLTIVLTIALASVETAPAQQAAPQTARQALLEMLFSKTPGTFARHLPAITRATLDKTGAMASLQSYSMLANQIQAQGQNLETFETGSVLVSSENPATGQKFEILVEDDSLRGDQDDLLLSFQISKNGTTERTPYMPQMTFSMKKEAQLWTLNEISLTIHIPLADPDVLKSFADNMAAKPRAQNLSGARSETPAQTVGSDSMVLTAMRTILTAQVTYAATYPAVGYSCTLSDLDGFGGGERNEHQAMLINSGLASGKKYGYVFTLTECAGTPARRFRLTATPNASTFGRKTFCADEAGAIRSSEDANPAQCMASGTPVK